MASMMLGDSTLLESLTSSVNTTFKCIWFLKSILMGQTYILLVYDNRGWGEMKKGPNLAWDPTSNWNEIQGEKLGLH
jgi:hypothetical protein